MSTLWETSMAFKPPRTVFLDFPLGCPAGKPNEPELQRDILRAALRAATVKDLYRKDLGTVAAHVADHRARGESLLGREKEFAIRCNC